MCIVTPLCGTAILHESSTVAQKLCGIPSKIQLASLDCTLSLIIRNCTATLPQGSVPLVVRKSNEPLRDVFLTDTTCHRSHYGTTNLLPFVPSNHSHRA